MSEWATVSERKMTSPVYTLTKKVERNRRIPSHGVAALSAFGIEEETPFRDCIGSLLIDFER